MKQVKKYKLCRRLGSQVFEQCQNAKFATKEANKKTKNKKRPKPLSSYAEQLYEKQRIRFSYGISQKQLSNYVKKSVSTKGAIPSESLGSILESRLDNVVYRLGLAGTRRLSRQMVSHGHICVNGKKLNVASHIVKIGDEISVREGSKKSVLFQDLAKKLKDYNMPNWLTFNPETLIGTVKGKPKTDDAFLDFNKVLEFYSR